MFTIMLVLKGQLDRSLTACIMVSGARFRSMLSYTSGRAVLEIDLTGSTYGLAKHSVRAVSTRASQTMFCLCLLAKLCSLIAEQCQYRHITSDSILSAKERPIDRVIGHASSTMV